MLLVTSVFILATARVAFAAALGDLRINYLAESDARGIDDSLLAELEDARIRAAGVGVRIAIGIVAFDTAATVAARLSVLRGPREQTRMITLDTLARLAAG